MRELTDAILMSLSRHARKSRIARIVIEPMVDSLGEEGLRIRLILQKKAGGQILPREQLLRVIDDTRGMLAADGDQRFPYFEVTTEKNEKEKQRELERLRAG